MLFLTFLSITNWPTALLRVAGCPCACGDSLFPLSTSTKAQSGGQNSHDHNRLYQFQSISPPFVASCTARVGSHTDNNVFVKFFGCISPCLTGSSKSQVLVDLFVEIWRGAPLPLRDEGVAAPIEFRSRIIFVLGSFKSLLNYNCGILVDQFEQLDHVCVPHPHTAMTRGGPDFVLVSGAMNINEPVPRICIMLFQSVQP